MSEPELIALIEKRLFHGDDAEFIEILHRMKDDGVPQITVYECMLAVWDRLNVQEHDKELDRLANWLDVVTGNLAGPRVWERRIA